MQPYRNNFNYAHNMLLQALDMLHSSMSHHADKFTRTDFLRMEDFINNGIKLTHELETRFKGIEY